MEPVPPPVFAEIQRKKLVQTSADREKNTENDVSSIQDIQEMPGSTARSFGTDSESAPKSLTPDVREMERAIDEGKRAF